MKLLIVTQAVDKNDPVLGFFHRWIEEFATHYEEVTVIALRVGTHTLPANVRIFSLGKDEGKGRFTYLVRFFRLIYTARNSYDAVFVHMNQEYILLGGLLWKMLGKSVYLWRNHHAGNFLTDVAVSFSRKVFCTSRYSYTAKYTKTLIMPVGIDTQVFSSDSSYARKDNSLLMLGRIAPSKRIDIFLNTLSHLTNTITYEATIVGDALPRDRSYADMLARRVAENHLPVTFHPGIQNEETVGVYRTHDVTINCSSSGMYDKTIFEAMACGSLILASNKNLEGQINPLFIFKEGDVKDLASKLHHILSLADGEKNTYRKELQSFVRDNHSLSALGARLAEALHI